MAADDFFARWSKRNAQPALAPDVVADQRPAVEAKEAIAGPKPVPTLADVDGLTAESDYTAFLAHGVDETVKRSAMKKLFALPQFNIMDGLDIYIGDYSQPDPLPPGMLEALVHARDALNPAQIFGRPVAQLLDRITVQTLAAENQPEPLPPTVNDATPDAELNAALDARENPAPALRQEITSPNLEPARQQPNAAETSEMYQAQNKNEAV